MSATQDRLYPGLGMRIACPPGCGCRGGASGPTPTAWGRAEDAPCQRGTVGCSVDHVGRHQDAGCATW